MPHETGDPNGLHLLLAVGHHDRNRIGQELRQNSGSYRGCRAWRSYLSAEPLEAAGFGPRVVAKIVDFAIVASVLALAVLVVRSRRSGLEGDAGVGVPELILVFLFVISPLYTVLSEYFAGKTVGKWLTGLRVVRESGARIGLGQAFVRQLALILQVFVFDCLFALFTERRQRACEFLSKTRVVR